MMEGLIENLEDAWNIDYSDIEFERLIGKGAFGEVYEGRYFGTPVAIKRVYESDEDSLLYLEREINVLKGMRHPNIVQFIGICKDDVKGFHIVTEYVSGGDLRKKLKDKSLPMSWRLKADIAHQIACAVAYLHSRSIIHRDLKSKNLLVDTNWKIKVCDFGFARTAQKGTARPMTICGTGEWMAPEIILGQAYSQKADVFSFGIVMCEIISRKKITTELQRSALDAFGLDVDKFLNLVPEDCPMELQSIALECCVFEQDHRPTFKQLITRLSAIIKSLPRDDPPKQAPATTVTPAKPAPAPAPTPTPTPAPTAGRGTGGVGAPKPAPSNPSNPSWNRRGTAADFIAASAPKIQPTVTRSPTNSKVNNSLNTPTPSAPPKLGGGSGNKFSTGNSPTNNFNKGTTPAPANNFNKGNSPNSSATNGRSNTLSVPTSGGTNGTASPQGSSKRARPPPRPMTMYGEQAKNVSTVIETTGPGYYSYEVLKTSPPKDLDKGNLPEYLDPSEFPTVFGMSRDEYFKLPKWKQIAKKSEVGLF